MTSEGGTKSSFSPFLMFFKATSPLSPTSTLSIPIFCGGSPDSDSHLCRAEEFSSESISQPQATGFVWAAAPADTEHWTWCLRDDERLKWRWPTWVLGVKKGRRVECNVILEASAMAMAIDAKTRRALRLPYLLNWSLQERYGAYLFECHHV